MQPKDVTTIRKRDIKNEKGDIIDTIEETIIEQKLEDTLDSNVGLKKFASDWKNKVIN